jgi:Zinc carboxypeptidase
MKPFRFGVLPRVVLGVVWVLCLAACETPPLSLPTAPESASQPAKSQALADLALRRARAAAQFEQHPPYSPEVAAVFADPDVTYDTPALEPDRKAYTRANELATFMQDVVSWSQSSPSSVVRVQRLSLGTSQGGVPIEALRFSKKRSQHLAEKPKPAGSLRRSQRRSHSARQAAVAQSTHKPLVLLIAEQHGDEPAGAEALVVVSQQLANGPLTPVLDQLDVVVVPRANPDGAARAMHKTQNGVDLNHDHLLLRTPEAVALAQLAQDTRPVLVVDLHEYTVPGTTLDALTGIQRFDALIQHATSPQVPDLINRAANEWFHPALVKDLQRASLSSEWYHTFVREKGTFKAVMGSPEPDNARNAFGLRNAVSFQIESRGAGLGHWHLKRRIHTHVVAVTSLLRNAARRSTELARLRRFVDHDVAQKACKGQAVLAARPTASERQLVMLDPSTGTDKIVTVPWDSSLVLEPSLTVARPCAYRLAGDQIKAVQNLRTLGLRVKPGAAQQFDVGLDQAWAGLAMSVLEPGLANSYATHGIVKPPESVQRVMVQPRRSQVADHHRAARHVAHQRHR